MRRDQIPVGHPSIKYNLLTGNHGCKSYSEDLSWSVLINFVGVQGHAMSSGGGEASGQFSVTTPFKLLEN